MTTGIPTASRPPLYPFLIAAFWVDGHRDDNDVELVPVICGAATVVLIYLIAKDPFSHRVALLAALAVTFAPMTLHS